MTDAVSSQVEDDNVAAAVASGLAARDAAHQLAASTRDCLRAGSSAVRQRLTDSPYASLGVAAGVGFVVAGGLASPLARHLLGVGTRVAFATAAQYLVSAMTTPLSSVDAPQAAAPPTTGPPTTGPINEEAIHG